MKYIWQKRVAWAVVAVFGIPLSAMAQQQQPQLPRPIILYRSPSPGARPARGPATIVTATSTQTGSNSKPAAGNVPNPANGQAAQNNQVPGGTLPGRNATVAGFPQTTAPAGNQPVDQAGVAAANGTTTNGKSNGQNNSDPSHDGNQNSDGSQQQLYPTTYALQNASGLQNISQSGITAAQQYAPNSYFGQQFHNWSNQQTTGDSPASYGEMSRMQPGQFGGYVAPNNYFGSGFSTWTNLSFGGISPSTNGTWTYSTWTP